MPATDQQLGPTGRGSVLTEEFDSSRTPGYLSRSAPPPASEVGLKLVHARAGSDGDRAAGRGPAQFAGDRPRAGGGGDRGGLRWWAGPVRGADDARGQKGATAVGISPTSEADGGADRLK